MSSQIAHVRDLRFPKAVIDPIRHTLKKKPGKVEFNDVLEHLKINEEQFNSPSYSIRGDQFLSLYRWIYQNTKSQVSYKEWVEAFSLTTVGLAGLASMAASTLRDALLIPARFLHLYLPALKVELIEQDTIARLEVSTTSNLDEINLYLIEMIVGVIYSIQFEIMPAPIQVSIHFKHKIKEDKDYLARLKEYESLFGKNVYFESEFNGIQADIQCLDLPLRNPNEASYKTAVKLLEEEAGKVKSNLGFDAVVRTELMRLAREQQFLSLEDFANRINQSPRTLMRKLKSHETNYKSLSNEVKLALSKDLLENSGLSIKQIADKSGFSTTSSFCRVFKKTNHQTPEQWRDLHKST